MAQQAILLISQNSKFLAVGTMSGRGPLVYSFLNISFTFYGYSGLIHDIFNPVPIIFIWNIFDKLVIYTADLVRSSLLFKYFVENASLANAKSLQRLSNRI